MKEFKYDVAVIGLGYVGLPLAVEASINDVKVLGFDEWVKINIEIKRHSWQSYCCETASNY